MEGGSGYAVRFVRDDTVIRVTRKLEKPFEPSNEEKLEGDLAIGEIFLDGLVFADSRHNVLRLPKVHIKESSDKGQNWWAC